MPRNDRDINDERFILADPDAESLRTSPDAARNSPGDPHSDPTGIGPVMEIMSMARQIYTAARVSGFPEEQAFQLSRDWFTTMTKISGDRT